MGCRSLRWVRCALLLSVLPFMAGARSLAAQATASTFGVELTAGASRAAYTGWLSGWWRSSPGLRASLVSPYGPGALRLSAEAARQHALRPGLPDYLSVFPSVEWGLTGSALRGTRFYLGGGLGAYWSHFEGVETNPTELEVGVVGTALVRRALGAGWLVGGGAELRRIFTSRPLQQASLFVELGRALGIPGSSMDGDPSGAPPEEQVRSVQLAPATGPSLGEEGVLRPSEIFRALPGWDVVTVDQRSGWAAPEGLPVFDDRGYEVLVDGIPVPLEVLGSVSLDRLPLVVDELAGVESRSAPGLIEGSFRGRPGLHFPTAPPAANGIELQVSARGENPTGDPGPRLFADSTAGNLDKLGTGFGVFGRWRAGFLSGSAGLAQHSDLVTGPHLGERDPLAIALDLEDEWRAGHEAGEPSRNRHGQGRR